MNMRSVFFGNTVLNWCAQTVSQWWIHTDIFTYRGTLLKHSRSRNDWINCFTWKRIDWHKWNIFKKLSFVFIISFDKSLVRVVNSNQMSIFCLRNVFHWTILCGAFSEFDTIRILPPLINSIVWNAFFLAFSFFFFDEFNDDKRRKLNATDAFKNSDHFLFLSFFCSYIFFFFVFAMSAGFAITFAL